MAAKKRKMKFTDRSQIRDVSERNHIWDWDISESVSAVGVIKRTPTGCKSQGLSMKRVTKEIRAYIIEIKIMIVMIKKNILILN